MVSLPHAVARLRDARLARAEKPFLARGGPQNPRCPNCRVRQSHCLCALRPQLKTEAGVCLLMGDTEMLKPSNTGWLIADLVERTFAFNWARTWVDPALLTLLADPQWQPYVVFPGELAAPERVVTQVDMADGKRPLFVLLDGTWAEAGKMLRKSPYLDAFPVLSLSSEQVSRYKLRRRRIEGHFCTAEVGALCLEQAGETRAAQTLTAYLDVFTTHYLQAKNQMKPNMETAAHQQLRALV